MGAGHARYLTEHVDGAVVTALFDLDGPQAINVASILNAGTYLSGRKLNPAPNFFICSVENPFAPPHDYRIERAMKKHRAGAQMLQLQIGYHPDRLEKFCAGVAATVPGLAIIPSVVLIKSAKPLSFMNDKVPGISVPQEVIDRELEVGKDLARQEGKPEEMLEKIAAGRLNKFFKENTLVDQDFIKDSKLSVSKYLTSVQAGLAVVDFKRVSL